MRTEKQTLILSTLVVTFVFAVFFCYLAFTAGQDANWDFYNYHYYNAYAFLGDRFWYDIQPAQRQTFFSPFLDVPFYWLSQKLGILGASLVYAVFQSLQAPALFVLSYLLVKNSNVNWAASAWIALILAPIFQCAVKRRHFSVGEIPTRQLSFQPVAIGTVMEVTK